MRTLRFRNLQNEIRVIGPGELGSEILPFLPSTVRLLRTSRAWKGEKLTEKGKEEHSRLRTGISLGFGSPQDFTLFEVG